MALTSGKDMLLRLNDGQGGYDTIGGLRTKTFSLSAGTVDITHADSNGWRELLPCGGIRQATVSGNGLFIDGSAAERARALFFSGEHASWRLHIPDYGDLDGPFQITSLDYAGEYRGEATFSLTLVSAGEVTFTAATP
ncbi:MAG: phage major tail protein, TP901-1 family [Pseudomonadota bacterium]